jgi:hypothetical protein
VDWQRPRWLKDSKNAQFLDYEEKDEEIILWLNPKRPRARRKESCGAIF